MTVQMMLPSLQGQMTKGLVYFWIWSGVSLEVTFYAYCDVPSTSRLNMDFLTRGLEHACLQ